MRNLKKFLALVLALMMTFSLMVTVNAAQSPADFDDIGADDSDYAEAINVLSALGVINGYEMDDGSTIFNPKGDIKRSEVAAILYRIAANDAGDKQVGLYKDYDQFTDVPSDAWYAGAVNYCANSELVIGVNEEQTRYAPHSNVTGYQVLAMVLRMLGYDANDEFRGTGWQIRTASYARQVGLTKNIKEGTLGQNATREMVAEIMFQALQAPTVTYNMLTNYTPTVLVDKSSNSNGYVYAEPVYNTLMYANYSIVGKRTVMGIDDYGRPVEMWMKDSDADTIAGGSKFVVNYEAPVEFKAVNGDTINLGAVHCWGMNGETKGASYNWEDEVALAIPLTSTKTFYDAITECELTKAINNDKSIAWKNIDEYVNGGLVANRDDEDNGAELDKLHTTNTSAAGTGKSDYTIGAQGRVTEIYKYTVPGTAADGTPNGKTVTKWAFVYIDILLGEVEKVVPMTKDTAGHTNTPAELHINVNDTVKGASAIVMKDNTADFTQKKGDLVLLTTYGFQDDTDTANSGTKIGDGDGSAIVVNDSILGTVPSVANDFMTNSVDANGDFDTANQVWAVDFASDSVGENKVVPTTTLTIDGTVGLADDKTGVIASGKTYPTTWAYHVDHDDDANVADDTHHTTADVKTDAVLGTLCVNVTNQIIGQTYTVALDKQGNILGMWQDKSDKIIGVVTDVDYARVGLGKYAVEMEVFTVGGKTETVRVLDDMTVANGHDYFKTQDDADTAINTPNSKLSGKLPSNDLTPKGALLELTSYIKDGETYWEITDSCDTAGPAGTAEYYGDVEASDAGGDGKVRAGKADTLTGAVHTGNQMTDETVFIVAEYDFRYNTGSGNDGSNIDVRYNVYKGFRNLPAIDADEKVSGNIYNLAFQILDDKIDGAKATGKAGYVLISAINPDKKYTITKNPTIMVDDSFLVVKPLATYAEYSEYSVAKNGELTTIKVANVNGTVNADLQAAIRTTGLLVATSENSKGYITAVDEVKDVAQWADNLGGYTDTKIGANKGLAYSDGVLSWTDGTKQYLTVAENCIVKIVNVDNGQLYPATLDNIKQYQATKDIVFELDANGWVSCLYIID